MNNPQQVHLKLSMQKCQTNRPILPSSEQMEALLIRQCCLQTMLSSVTLMEECETGNTHDDEKSGER